VTWLYVPQSTPSPSALASEDSNSESPSLIGIGDKISAASVTWRGKHQQPQAWSRRWKRAGFIQRLSGLTLVPSTADLGVASFISSLQAIPAKTIAWPESEQDPAASGFLPQKSAALPKSAGLLVSSARTSRGTQTGSLKPSSRHWSSWATALRSEYSARPKPETQCDGSECSHSPNWPTAKATRGGWERDQHGNIYPTLQGLAENWPGPAVMDTADTMDLEKVQTRRDRHKARAINGNGFGISLSEKAQAATELWMAPNVPNGGRSTKHADQVGRTFYHEGKKVQLGLESQVRHWAGPAAQNHKGSSEGSMTRQDGKSRDDILSYQAEQFFRLPSSLDQPTIAGGAMSSTAGPNSNQPSVKRKLNPIFVEALMRWPTGLSGFVRAETGLIQWRQLMLIYLSMLFTRRPEPAQMTLL
jgi:hypothetical protein